MIKVVFLLLIFSLVSYGRMTVCFIDSGLNASLPQISPYVEKNPGYDFILNRPLELKEESLENSHGTSVVAKFISSLELIHPFAYSDVRIIMAKMEEYNFIQALQYLIEERCELINMSLSFAPSTSDKKRFKDYAKIVNENPDVFFLNTAGTSLEANVDLSTTKKMKKLYPYHLGQVKADNLIVLGSLLEHSVMEGTPFVIKSHFGEGVNLFSILSNEILPDHLGNPIPRIGGSFNLPQVSAQVVEMKLKERLVAKEIKSRILLKSKLEKTYCKTCKSKVMEVNVFR